MDIGNFVVNLLSLIPTAFHPEQPLLMINLACYRQLLLSRIVWLWARFMLMHRGVNLVSPTSLAISSACLIMYCSLVLI